MAQAIDIAREKVIWAKGKREALNGCLSEYLEGNPYRFIPGPDGKNKLDITQHPPVKVPIIVGEMLYQFRSALDHLFFDLVKRNHGKGLPPTGWETDCYFPLRTMLPKGHASPPIPRSDYKRSTRDALTDEAFAFIEGIQPYYSSFDRRREPQLLRMLAKLSNIDKHRRLNTTILTVGRTQTAVSSEGKTSTAFSPWLPSGAEIEPVMGHSIEITGDVEVSDEFTENVFFDEPEIELPHPTPVIDIVGAFPQFMLDFMIPNFKKLIENHATVPITR